MFDQLVFSVMTHPRASFAERVDAATEAGYAGIGLRPRDLRRARETGCSDGRLRAMLSSLTMGVVEIDAIVGWGGTDEHVRRAQEHEGRVFELADVLGGQHVTIIGDVLGPRDRSVELLASLADRAAEHGLAVGLEYLPWTNVATLSQALDLVTATGRGNVGLVVDAWHHFHGDCDWVGLESVPGERIVAVQFDDAAPPDERSLQEQTFDRRLPGEGVLDLVRLLEAVARTGTGAPLCLEVISPKLAEKPVTEVARSGYEATSAMLRLAGLRDAPDTP